jgi:hypothetical protein
LVSQSQFRSLVVIILIFHKIQHVFSFLVCSYYTLIPVSYDDLSNRPARSLVASVTAN